MSLLRRTFIPLVFGGGLANRVKAAPADLAVTPTPLYTRAGTRLERLLAASINDPALSSGSLELTAGGRARRIRVDGLERSGSRVLVPIQALDETTTVHCSYRRGDILWSTRLTVAPERLWKIFVVHHSHQDPGYLGLPDKMRADFIAYLDEALDYCSRTRNRDPRARFKWTIEVGYLLEDYRKARGEEAFSRVIAAIKSGAMELGALYVSAQSEFLGVEPLHRLLTYSSLKLPREFGIEVRTALHDDVPGFTWGLAEALAHSGVRYLLFGGNSYRANLHLDSIPPLFYWQGPAGSEVLVWRSAHYKEGIALVDHEEGKADFSEPDTLAASWLGRYSRGTYPLDSILLQTAADFIRPQAGLSDNVEAWNRRFAYPELRIATPAEYFRHVEQGNTAAIPRLRGAFPDTWNDQKATMAAPSALARRLESGLPDAEKWATLCASAGLGTTSPDASFEEAYHQLLMYEDHTLGWVARNDPYTPEKDGGGQEHYRQKAAYAEKAEQQRSQAQQQSLRALTRQVGGGAGLVVWNPLSWSRAGLAELPKGCNAASLRDRATGAILACQTDHTGTRFWSSDVPALGYRSYDVLTTSPAPAGTGFRRDSTTLENDFYLIRIDPPSGGIASLVDKLTGRDLVDARAPHKLGQLAYLLYRQESLSRFTTLGELRPGKFWVEAGPSGAVSSSIKASGMIEHALTFELEVTLYAAVKRIDLALRVNKRVNYAKEVVCAAFPFCIQQEPDRYGQARIPVQVDFPGGWFRPEHDQLPSSGFDTYVSQHAVQLEDPGMRVVWASLDVPAFHIGGVHASRWLQTLSGQGRELQKPWLYSHIMSNHWVTNCPIAQGGAVLFRYSIVSGRPERELGPAKRFGWEAASPLVAVAGEGAGHWPATRPLLEVSPASAGLAGLKRAEDGDELIARIVEGTGHAADVVMTPGVPGRELAGAWLCDATEKRLSSLPVEGGVVRFPLSRFESATVRFRLQPKAGQR